MMDKWWRGISNDESAQVHITVLINYRKNIMIQQQRDPDRITIFILVFIMKKAMNNAANNYAYF